MWSVENKTSRESQILIGRTVVLKSQMEAFRTLEQKTLRPQRASDCCSGNIRRAIPLQHGHITLSPMLEIAFGQVEAMLQEEEEEEEGLEIVGYYQANSHHDDVSVPHAWLPSRCGC